VEIEPDEGDNNPWRYCGEYFDRETGDIYLRARYYNPKTGRFKTEDPIGDGLNWYTYCANNPIRFSDPSGLALVDTVAYAKANGAKKSIIPMQTDFLVFASLQTMLLKATALTAGKLMILF